MQMGNFTTQFYQYLRESLRNGTWQDKSRFLATMGGVYGAFKLAKAVTGYDFDRWQFHHSLTFTGGPLVQPIADVLSGSSVVVQMVWQEGGTQTNSGRFQEEKAGRLGDAMDAAFRMLNPAGGAMRTGQGIAQALESPDPANALARLFFTGERGAAPDWRAEFSRTFGPPPPTPPSPQQMVPLQSPVRAGAVAAPDSIQVGPPPVDTSFIPFTANPQPGQPSGYTPDQVYDAWAGDTTSQTAFRREEVAFLNSLPRNLRREDVLSIFGTYMQAKTHPGVAAY